jgi:ubiquitin C-terminal hydrolase
MYSHPQVDVHKPGLEVLKMANMINKEKARRTRPGSSGVDLGVCLTEFCKVQRLSLEDNWRCPRCKDFREGLQNMNLWRLPDLLTFHIKRFNMSARWREKLTTKVNFPLTGLDLNEWCHKESPAIQVDGDDSHVYDLVGVMNHYGSMTGGHYVATCRATACGKDGKEEVAYDFNGYGTSTIESKGTDTSTGWRLSRPKAETNFQKEAAQVTAQSAAESAEPLWLQFDDELVEPIPPRSVVSDTAYVLFYRRRRITPSNIARYSTLE